MKWLGPVEVAITFLVAIIGSTWFLSQQMAIHTVKIDTVIEQVEKLDTRVGFIEKDVLNIRLNSANNVVQHVTKSGSNPEG